MWHGRSESTRHEIAAHSPSKWYTQVWHIFWREDVRMGTRKNSCFSLRKKFFVFFDFSHAGEARKANCLHARKAAFQIRAYILLSSFHERQHPDPSLCCDLDHVLGPRACLKIWMKR